MLTYLFPIGETKLLQESRICWKHWNAQARSATHTSRIHVYTLAYIYINKKKNIYIYIYVNVCIYVHMRKLCLHWDTCTHIDTCVLFTLICRLHHRDHRRGDHIAVPKSVAPQRRKTYNIDMHVYIYIYVYRVQGLGCPRRANTPYYIYIYR